MRNDKGQIWVMVQFALLLVLLVMGLWQPNTLRVLRWLSTLGIALLILGIALLAVSGLNLGPNLTAMPKPIDDGVLVQNGLYRFVRHPIYFSVLLCSLGWSLWRMSWAALLITVILYIFFDRKAAREEIWLREKYPNYDEYAKRVKKLMPF